MQAPVTPGEVIDGKYRVDRVLASGGMGVVVVAWHLELAQEVAIKFLLTQGADAKLASQRLRREARAAARIRSQHVARVFDVGTLRDEVPYMVMEFLEGNDLADELAERGRLPIEEAVYYVLQSIEALAEAHAAGIVHCDLKPENIFLSLRADGTRSVKLLDFGISKWVLPDSVSDLSLNRALLLGSPPYMSPERMRSEESVDHRADIWSLGTILYEAVTGQAPHQGPSLAEVCASVFDAKPPSMPALRPDVPVEFEAAVLRCLEKQPADRYANVAELAEALVPFAPGCHVYAERAQRVLSGIPLSGRPTPIPPDPSSGILRALRVAQANRGASADASVSVPAITASVMSALAAEAPAPPPADDKAAVVPRARAGGSRVAGQRWAIVFAALSGTLFGVAAWTVSSARGAPEPQVEASGQAPVEIADAPEAIEPRIGAARPSDPNAGTATAAESPPSPPLSRPSASAAHKKPTASPRRWVPPARRRAPKPPVELSAPAAAPAPAPVSEPVPPPAADETGVPDFGGRR